MSSTNRVDWDEYFMGIAILAASRSTCSRKHVGAVIVRQDNTIVSTGYNGSIKGLPHCDDVGHLLQDTHCVRTVHAEANAIIQAATHGVPVTGCRIYTTASPCLGCFKLIAQSGICCVIYGEFYRDDRVFELASQAGITVVHLEETNGEKTE